MKIRECFDSFFSRLERFEHYIESGLISERSVYVYLSFWIDALLGKTKLGAKPRLKEEYRVWLMNYGKHYDFFMLESLLDRYKAGRRLIDRLSMARMNRNSRNKPSDPAAPTPNAAAS
jgi:hypothetical protein